MKSDYKEVFLESPDVETFIEFFSNSLQDPHEIAYNDEKRFRAVYDHTLNPHDELMFFTDRTYTMVLELPDTFPHIIKQSLCDIYFKRFPGFFKPNTHILFVQQEHELTLDIDSNITFTISKEKHKNLRLVKLEPENNEILNDSIKIVFKKRCRHVENESYFFKYYSYSCKSSGN